MTSPLVASPSVLAVETEVTAAVAALVATAPSTLDTLAELAAALGNDPNLSTTLTTLIATKATPADIATAVAAEASARTTAVAGEASARTTAINAAIANLVNSAPGVLDTLSEIAAALGNDPNLSTTLTALIATKASPADITTAVNTEVTARNAAISTAVAAIPADAAAGTPALRTLGTTATKAAAGNDARLSDARTPLAHHASHEVGGSDPLTSYAALAHLPLNVADHGNDIAAALALAAQVTTIPDAYDGTTARPVKQVVYVPDGLYTIATMLTLPQGVSLVCSPRAYIKATVDMAAMIDTALNVTHQDNGIYGGIWDANNHATYAIYPRSFAHFTVEVDLILNVLTAGVVLGDPASSAVSYEGVVGKVRVWRSNGQAVPSGSIGVWVRWATDSHIGGRDSDITGVDIGVRNDKSSNWFKHLHVWGYSGGFPTTAFLDNGQFATWTECDADTPSSYGWRITASSPYTHINGGQVYVNGSGSDNSIVGINIESASNPVVTLDSMAFRGNDGSHRLAKDINGDTSLAKISGSQWANCVTQTPDTTTFGSRQLSAALGATLLTNGSVAADASGWTLGSGWAWGSSKITHTSGGGTADVSQSVTTVAGQGYEFTWTNSTETTGFIRVGFADANQFTYRVGAGANLSAYIVAPSTGVTTLTITPSTDFNGSLSAMSLKAVTASTPAMQFGNSAGGTEGALRVAGSSLTNIGLGASALPLSTTGTSNTAIGHSALATTVSGGGNTAIGYSALRVNTAGYGNTAVGQQALELNPQAIYNTAVGFGALQFLSSGIAINNVAVGRGAGALNVSNASLAGLQNVWLGSRASPSSGNDPSNAVCIGFNSIVNADGAIAIGSQAQATAAGAVAIGRDNAGTAVTNATANTIALGTSLHSILVGGGAGLGSGAGVISIHNASTLPSTNPSSGGLLYCDAGALKYRGSSGTVTTLGVA